MIFLPILAMAVYAIYGIPPVAPVMPVRASQRSSPQPRRRDKSNPIPTQKKLPSRTNRQSGRQSGTSPPTTSESKPQTGTRVTRGPQSHRTQNIRTSAPSSKLTRSVSVDLVIDGDKANPPHDERCQEHYSDQMDEGTRSSLLSINNIPAGSPQSLEVDDGGVFVPGPVSADSPPLQDCETTALKPPEVPIQPPQSDLSETKSTEQTSSLTNIEQICEITDTEPPPAQCTPQPSTTDMTKPRKKWSITNGVLYFATSTPSSSPSPVTAIETPSARPQGTSQSSAANATKPRKKWSITNYVPYFATSTPSPSPSPVSVTKSSPAPTEESPINDNKQNYGTIDSEPPPVSLRHTQSNHSGTKDTKPRKKWSITSLVQDCQTNTYKPAAAAPSCAESDPSREKNTKPRKKLSITGDVQYFGTGTSQRVNSKPFGSKPIEMTKKLYNMNTTGTESKPRSKPPRSKAKEPIKKALIVDKVQAFRTTVTKPLPATSKPKAYKPPATGPKMKAPITDAMRNSRTSASKLPKPIEITKTEETLKKRPVNGYYRETNSSRIRRLAAQKYKSTQNVHTPGGGGERPETRNEYRIKMCTSSHAKAGRTKPENCPPEGQVMEKTVNSTRGLTKAYDYKLPKLRRGRQSI